MAYLGQLDELHDLMVARYFVKVAEAEAARDKETRAAIAIQAAARGFLMRCRLRFLTATAITLQKQWRGYLGRLRFKLFRRLENARLRKEYFDAQATQIQRWFRGFYSRKYVHNFLARKAYLAHVQQKSLEVREAARAAMSEVLESSKEEAARQARVCFHSRIKRLHHLVSTAAQPGVLNSPFQVITGTRPMVDGFAVEDHIQVVTRQSVKKLPPLKAAREVKVREIQLPLFASELLGNVRRRTLQSLPNYDRLRQEAVLEQRIQQRQIQRCHSVAFTSSGSSPEPYMPVQSNRNLEPYTGLWDPTIGNKRELMDRASKQIANHLFIKSWHPQMAFGDSLPDGAGV